MANELVIRKDTIRDFFEEKLDAIFDTMFDYQAKIFDKIDADDENENNDIPEIYKEDDAEYHVANMIFNGKWNESDILRRFPYLANTDDLKAIKECLHFTMAKADSEYVPQINSTMLDIVKTMKPKHGDTVRWIYKMNQDYRNSNLIGFVWMKNDEFKIIPVYTEIDDYGSVPPQFVVGEQPGEFSPGYWKNVVDHNGINFLSQEIQERIRSCPPTKKIHKYTLNKGNKYEKEIIEETWETQVKIDGITYTVTVEDPEMKNLGHCNAYEPNHLEFD